MTTLEEAFICLEMNSGLSSDEKSDRVPSFASKNQFTLSEGKIILKCEVTNEKKGKQRYFSTKSERL